MRLRSSIFSFETLKGPWPVPVAGVLAICLVASAEGAARWMVARGYLEADPSLHQLVTQSLKHLQRDRPQQWLLGNSTLDAAVDERIVGAALDGGMVTMPHGSATLRGLGAMLEFYLRHVDYTPQAAYLFVTHDDLNANGYRAGISRAYLTINATDRVPSDPQWLTLRSARTGIRRRLTLSGGAETTGTPAPPVFDGQPIRKDDPFYVSLTKNYALDERAFSIVAGVGQRHGLNRVVVVLLPVTAALAHYGDEVHPDMSYLAIRRRVAQLCAASGLELIDWSEPIPQNELFRDAYHLNANGKSWLSRRFVDWLTESTELEAPPNEKPARLPAADRSR